MPQLKPQKGNPHRLTINQHIIPAASLARFSDIDGKVRVRRHGVLDDLNLLPKNPFFCAMRRWDQKSEAGYMKDIEDRFQRLCTDIITNNLPHLISSQHEIVTEYYILWSHRHHYNTIPIPDQSLNRVKEERSLTVDEQEYLEASGVMFFSNNTMASRFLTGPRILMDIDWNMEALAGRKWGIVRSELAHFILPDNFRYGTAVPISPTVCLVLDAQDGRVAFDVVAEINGYALKSSKAFLIWTGPDKAPIIPLRTPGHATAQLVQELINPKKKYFPVTS